MFLPPNTTAAIQPMDQAVLEIHANGATKGSFLHASFRKMKRISLYPTILKAITIKDAVYWIAEAWEEASSDSLRKAWRNLLHESVSEDVSTEDTCPDSSIAETIETAGSLGSETQEAIAEWMDADIDEPGHEVLDDDEIVAEMQNSRDSSAEESSQEIEENQRVSASAAFDALELH